jgi:hypothetical protein
MDISLGPFQPDLGETQSMVIANNVLPHVNGYGPLASLYTAPAAQALPDVPRGVFSVVLNSGAWEAYLFTGTALYQLQSNFSLNVIQSGFACPVGINWSGLHFGNKLLFTNTVDGLQSYDVEVGGSVSAIAGAGNPAYIFSCANFLVALNCLDNTGVRNNRLIKTSGFNDQTNWTTDGADYQALADGEALVAGFDLKNRTGLILQTRSLQLITFGNATSGAQFSLDKIADGRGSVGPDSCASFDGKVFFLDTDDFYMYTGDNVLSASPSAGASYATHGIIPIGANAVTRWFLGQVDQANLELVQASVDPINKVVYWRYKRAIDASSVVSQVMIAYEWNIGRWFTVTEPTSWLARLATVGVAYDAATGTYDSQMLMYDDRYWIGNAPLSGALDANYKFATRSGPSLKATLTTQLANNPISGKLLWGTQITDALAPSLELCVKDKLSDPAVWIGGEIPGESGRTPLEGRGLNIQFRMTIPAGDAGATGSGWSYVNGIDHIASGPGGPK